MKLKRLTWALEINDYSLQVITYNQDSSQCKGSNKLLVSKAAVKTGQEIFCGLTDRRFVNRYVISSIEGIYWTREFEMSRRMYQTD